MNEQQREEQRAEMFAPVDRSKWPAGPWDGEPDRVEWRAHGFVCLAKRNDMGTWCGYVAVPPGHPLHGKDYSDLNFEVHGDLTYSDACRGGICHVPARGEPADVWWLGFDCGHAFDLVPGMIAFYRLVGHHLSEQSTYRDLAFVRGEIESLAAQIADVR